MTRTDQDPRPPAPRRLVLYHFSGTGNSRNVSAWLAQEAASRGIETCERSITDLAGLRPPAQPQDTWLALVSPVHGFNYPPVMLSFLARLPRGNNPVLLLNTRAGMRIGSWVTPGLSGLTFHLATLILWWKGYSVRGWLPVDLPSNWIALHPGLNQATVAFLHGRCRGRVAAFANRTLGGRRDFRALREIVQDLLAAPIAIPYYLVGRFLLAKTLFANRDCDGCEACRRGCPVGAIRLAGGRPFWTFSCESCMRCVGSCPRAAIEVGHGASALWVWLAVSLSAGLCDALLPVARGGRVDAARMLLEIAAWLLVAGLGYRAQHALLGLAPVERLLAWTSLTHYPWWGRRYRAPRP